MNVNVCCSYSAGCIALWDRGSVLSTHVSLNVQMFAVWMKALFTSRDEADGRQQSRLRVVHLDGQQLVGESEHQICERPEAGVVHLCAVQRQTVRERHRVLIRCITRADTQDLHTQKHTNTLEQNIIFIT